MNIQFHEASGVFSLNTAHTLYQMKADSTGVLLHLYYGHRLEGETEYRIRYTDRGFSGNPYEMRSNRGYSLDTLPQEYSGSGSGDYRPSAVQVLGENGSRTVDLRYAGHRIFRGREVPQGLPYVRGNEETETLEITLQDPAAGLEVRLMYTVFPSCDVIVRSAHLTNISEKTLTILKAASFSMDFPYGNFDVIHFHGRHCMERIPERIRTVRGQMSFGSRRGMSSHHSNPFVILCDRHATETTGACFGSMLVYSGSHLEEIDTDQAGSVRLVSGIHPDGFAWQLKSGETFETPDAVLSFSGDGLNGLSGQYHRLIREQIMDPRYRGVKQPVLINSWEAAYFDFDAEKILRFARAARDMGIGMLVLDDGWFGARNDDTAGLGDWVVNEAKLGCSMGELSDRIHDLGMTFGLWFEPEMVNEDSDLFRKHPDWALCDPDRRPVVARNQLVLDMSRQDVVDYLYQAMCEVLDHARIEYVKWDFNRSVANCYSHALPPERQGETAHRFMLGTYQLLSRLLERYPGLLIEGCSGGGGRFDAGMLFYCPQIWCSDDTDAIERLEIQRGTSYGYPVCAMGSHVSAAPNHQTGRVVSLHTRGIVAQSGTFGYELNPEQLSEEEKKEIRQQVEMYYRYAGLIREGTYYRLTELDGGEDYCAWMFVSPERKEALVSLTVTHARANGPFPFIRLQGLEEHMWYRLEGTDLVCSGAALMHAGYSFPLTFGEYASHQLHWIAEDRRKENV